MAAQAKYPQDPGLNLVSGEPGWNTAKVISRIVLAPLTLFISEGYLCSVREEPYRRYHSDLVDVAMKAAAGKSTDFSLVCDIAYGYAYLDESFSHFLHECMRRHPDTREAHWKDIYVAGIVAIDELVEESSLTTEQKNELKFGGSEDAHQARVFLAEKVEQAVRQLQEQRAAAAAARRANSEDNSQSAMHGNPGSSGLTPNAYGPGIHMDAYGRPVQLYTPGGVPGEHLQIKLNAYGPGVHMDQYGRPVYATPAF